MSRIPAASDTPDNNDTDSVEELFESQTEIVASCEFGATAEELEAILGDHLPAFQDWMRGQTMALCPEHGEVVYRSDLRRFLAGPSVRTALRQESLLSEALTTDDVAKLLKVSTGRVRQRNGEGTLFSMSGASRGLRFPRFQFTDHGELPGWGTVCKVLPEHANPVAVEYFLSHTHPDLAGGEITPAQWLAAGKPVEPVAALAEQAFTIR